MPGHEELNLDPNDVAQLERISRSITNPSVERNFGDDTDMEFNNHTEVVRPAGQTAFPGETPVEAHMRIQQERDKYND